ncbi:MAG TPA: alpha/beta hydrolase, partial [Arthrobacter sp.]
VLAGGVDPMTRPELGEAVARRIPGALFEVMPEESHQPFQEVPDEWNARVHEFWQQIRGGA